MNVKFFRSAEKYLTYHASGLSCGNGSKGSWVVLSTATERESNVLIVQVHESSGANRDFLLDLAIGAVNDEQTVIKNLPFSSRNVSQELMQIALPFVIAKGSRLQVRGQANAASSSCAVAVSLGYGGARPESPNQRILSLGVDEGDSGGTSIDPGGTAHTLGALVQLSSALPFDVHTVCVVFGNQGNSARTDATWLVSLFAGASGDEEIVIPEILLECNATVDNLVSSETFWLSRPIPKGSRLSAGARCSITDASDRLFDLALVVGGR